MVQQTFIYYRYNSLSVIKTKYDSEIENLEKEISDLIPELKQKETEYKKTSDSYFKIENKKDELQAKIDNIKKRMQSETFKKMVGDGEVVSFRQFYKDIRDGRDFTGKTIVWCSKDGKSGAFINLRIHDNAVKKKLMDSYHYSHSYNPDSFVNIIRDFPSLKFDDFGFDVSTAGSMVDGRTFLGRKLDDVFIFICITKTLEDFDNISDTEGMYFFDYLPYITQSYGGFNDENNLVTGRDYISKSDFKNYKLYPVKGGEYQWKI